RLHDAANEREEAYAAFGRIEPQRTSLGFGKSKKIEDQRQFLQQRTVQAAEQRSDPPSADRRALPRRDPEEAAEQIEQRTVRQRSAVSRTVSLDDGYALGTPSLDHLLAEPALPDARRSSNAYDLTVSRSGAAERRIQGGDFVGATDEAREAAGAGRLEARAGRRPA